MHKSKIWSASFAILIVLFASALAHAAKTGEKKPAPEKITISSETADVDMEAEEYTIPGVVEIGYGDMHIKGKNLKFNNKTRIAELSGNPLTADLGDGMKAEAGRVVLDIDKQSAVISGGCRLTQKQKDVLVEVESDKIETNFGERGWARSSGEVKIHYKKDAAADKDNQKQDEGSPKKQPMIETDEIFATAGSVFYTFDTQIVDASHTVRVVLKDGAFSADAMKGDLKKEKLTVSGGAQGKIKDVAFKADRMDIDYGAKEVDLNGGVNVQRDNGDHFQSEHIWFRYVEGNRSLKTGRVQVELKIDQEKIKKKIGPGKQAPEGGKP